MADVDVVAVLTAKPGSESVMREALTSLVAPTRAEAGCIAYDLYASDTDPQVFITIEKWRTQADVDAHMHSDHIQAAIAAAGDHFGAVPAIHSLSPVVVG